MAEDLSVLPKNLPAPTDDGACQHLLNAKIPSIHLPTTAQTTCNLASLQGWLVLFCYPMTGSPDQPMPAEWHWNDIPGARGCTPQACSYRDHIAQLETFDAQVFGLSTQSTNAQIEASQRLHLPYPLLSDSALTFTNALKLPTFNIDDLVFNKRVTIIALNGVIQHYFYPVFPPDKDVDHVIAWLSEHV